MEDQRNWTDASYKTYSTPLALPFPVLVAPGRVIAQSVALSCAQAGAGAGAGAGAVAPEAESAPAGESIRIGEASGRVVPEITVGASTAPGDTPARTDWPHAAGVLVELIATDLRWPTALDRAVLDAGGGYLDVRIVASAPEEVSAVLASLPGMRVRRVGVFSAESHISEPDLWCALEAGVAEYGIGAELVGGTRAHFTELNRTHERMPAAEVSALAFSVTPQMHSVGREQIIESIGVQRTVVESARLIAQGRPLHIGPITLRARFNAVAPGEPVANSTDPRQAAEALAAWLISSVDALAGDGVQSLSYFESWGPRGLGPTGGAEPYPVSRALDWLIRLQGHRLLRVEGDLPENVRVIAATADSDPADLTLLVANLSDCEHEISFTVNNTGFLASTANNSVTKMARETVPGSVHDGPGGPESFDLTAGRFSSVIGAGSAIWCRTMGPRA